MVGPRRAPPPERDRGRRTGARWRLRSRDPSRSARQGRAAHPARRAHATRPRRSRGLRRSRPRPCLRASSSHHGSRARVSCEPTASGRAAWLRQFARAMVPVAARRRAASVLRDPPEGYHLRTSRRGWPRRKCLQSASTCKRACSVAQSDDRAEPWSTLVQLVFGVWRRQSQRDGVVERQPAAFGATAVELRSGEFANSAFACLAERANALPTASWRGVRGRSAHRLNLLRHTHRALDAGTTAYRLRATDVFRCLGIDSRTSLWATSWRARVVSIVNKIGLQAGASSLFKPVSSTELRAQRPRPNRPHLTWPARASKQAGRPRSDSTSRRREPRAVHVFGGITYDEYVLNTCFRRLSPR